MKISRTLLTTLYFLTFILFFSISEATSLFTGADKPFYLLLFSGNPNLEVEPFFKVLSIIFSFLFQPEYSYNLLIYFSFGLKAILLAKFLPNSRRAFILGFLYIAFYFYAFYNRMEIGYIRNCLAINIFAFGLCCKQYYRLLVLSAASFLFHYGTGIMALLLTAYSYYTRTSGPNKLLYDSVIHIILHKRIKIPAIRRLLLFLLVSSLAILLILTIRTRLLEALLGTISSIRFTSTSPFKYWRLYAFIFSWASIYIAPPQALNFFKSRTSLNPFAPVTISIFAIAIGAYLPILTEVQRFTFNTLYLVSLILLFFLAENWQKSTRFFCSSTFIMLFFILNSAVAVYKVNFKQNYNSYVQDRQTNLRDSL